MLFILNSTLKIGISYILIIKQDNILIIKQDNYVVQWIKIAIALRFIDYCALQPTLKVL